jgi:hypothetical protein
VRVQSSTSKKRKKENSFAGEPRSSNYAFLATKNKKYRRSEDEANTDVSSSDAEKINIKFCS